MRVCFEIQQQPLHRLGVFVELDHALNDGVDRRRVQRLKIGNEIVRAGHVRFGVFVEAAMNGIVGALEQHLLAVLQPT